eukprot:g271.t1
MNPNPTRSNSENSFKYVLWHPLATPVALYKEKQLIEKRLNESINEQQRCEVALVENTANLQRQEKSYLDEIENLKLQLQLQTDQRNRVLEQRSNSHAMLKTQNYELQQQLNKLRVDYESLQSQCLCQSQLANALDKELRGLKGNTQGLKEEVRTLEELMRSYYDRIQNSFVNGEALVNRLKELKEKDQIQEQEIENLKQSCQKLERDLEGNRNAALVSDRQLQMLQQDLRDAHVRIKEEQDHKNRILQLLRDSEAESSKLEQTIDNQAERILTLQQKRENPVILTESIDVKEGVMEARADDNDQMDADRSSADDRISVVGDETAAGSILDTLLM